MPRDPGGRLARLATAFVVAACILALTVDARAQPPELHGHWVRATGRLTGESVGAVVAGAEALPALASLERVGGPYWFLGELTIAGAGRYVIDFKSSSTIARFRHLVLDAGGNVVSDQEGGIESAARNPFFLRHGREVDLGAGSYRVVTEISSPFLLAEPEPMVAALDDYREGTRPGDALVLIGLGMFLAFGVYYAVLGVARRRAADVLYAVFVLGNILYNASALLVLPQLAGMHWFYLVSAPILLSNIAYVVFVTKLLDIQRASHPRLARLGEVFVGLLVLAAVVGVLRPRWSLELDRAGVAIFATFGLVCAVVRTREGNSSARRYLLAVAALFVLAIAAISLPRLDASYFFVEHLGLVAVVTEAVLLALVLAHQIAVADVERHVALDRAAHHARIALTDALTGLPNRYALDRDLAKLPPGGSLTFIDLDSLKRYNDEFGHARGDELLSGFARDMVDALGDCATAYRLAGDEFAVACPGGDVAFVADAVTRAVRALRARGFEFAGASHGSARRIETESTEQLKRVADQRMYQQKAERKSLSPQLAAVPHESWRSPE